MYISTVFLMFLECDLWYPYAYFNGDFCCKFPNEKANYDNRVPNTDANCDGSSLALTSECCVGDQYQKCASPPLY